MTKFSFYFWRTLFILFTAFLLSSGISFFFNPLHGISPSLDASGDTIQKLNLLAYFWGSTQIIIGLWMIRKKPKSDKIIITILTIIHTIFYLLVVIPNVSAL